jgi:hypothetical protein
LSIRKESLAGLIQNASVKHPGGLGLKFHLKAFLLKSLGKLGEVHMGG